LSKTPDNLTILGKVTSVYGIKGWVKIHSYTEPKENIFSYPQWLINMDGQWKEIEVNNFRPQGKGLFAQLDNCQDRTLAQKYCQCDIAITSESLPEAKEGEFYYYQLEGLLVVTTDDVILGRVDSLFNTGANDVMIVKACKESLDGRERLLPYTDDCLRDINPENGTIKVDWDPEF